MQKTSSDIKPTSIISEEVVQFIRQLYNRPEGFIPLHEPRFIGNERKYVIDAIDSTFVSSVGEYVNRFEAMMAEITGAKYAIACVNGTAALHIALKMANVEANDEVLVQALTFVATTNAIHYCNAVPHFVDVDKETLGLSPFLLQNYLSQIAEVRDGVCYNKNTGRKIAACVPMHTFGFPAKIDEIVKICHSYHIKVVEDAAESLGSTYKGQHTGTFGLLGAFSFNGNKILTSGGGGAIVTDDEALAKRAKHITTTAKIPHRWEYVHDEIGYNYRMPNLNAALACAQLEMLDQFIENKRDIAERYNTFFKNKNTLFFNGSPNTGPNYWLNTLILNSEKERSAFLEYFNNKGIMCRPIWKLMHRLAMFKECPSMDLTNAEYLENRIVNLPSSVKL